MNPLSSIPTFILGTAAALLVGGPLHAQDLQVGGFFSNGYIASSHYNYLADTDGGTFEFAEAGLGVSWTPKNRTTINGQLFAFELGPYGNFNPLVDYLFVDHNFNRGFGIRAGRIKRELGVYYHIQDIDFARTSILLPIGIYDQRYRDISAALDGISAYGNVGLWNGAYLDYTFYAGQAGMTAEGGVAGFALTSISRFATNAALEYVNSDYNYGGQLWLSPGVDGLRIGLGSTRFVNIDVAATGNMPANTSNPYIAGLAFRSLAQDVEISFTHLSFDYFRGDWSLVGEVVGTSMTYRSLTEIGGTPVEDVRTDVPGDAWYISAARRFGPLEIAVAYTEYYGDRNNALSAVPSSAYNKDSQFSLRYDATDNWILKAEIHSINGTNRLFNELQQNPELTEEAWTLFAVKSTFFF